MALGFLAWYPNFPDTFLLLIPWITNHLGLFLNLPKGKNVRRWHFRSCWSRGQELAGLMAVTVSIVGPALASRSCMRRDPLFWTLFWDSLKKEEANVVFSVFFFNCYRFFFFYCERELEAVATNKLSTQHFCICNRVSSVFLFTQHTSFFLRWYGDQSSWFA